MDLRPEGRAWLSGEMWGVSNQIHLGERSGRADCGLGRRGSENESFHMAAKNINLLFFKLAPKATESEKGAWLDLNSSGILTWKPAVDTGWEAGSQRSFPVGLGSAQVCGGLGRSLTLNFSTSLMPV